MKTMIALFFWTTLFGGMIIMMISVGWLLGLFGIALIPCIALHIIAGIKGISRYRAMNQWVIWTSLLFLAFSLFRPDMDDKDPYTGYSVLFHYFGLRQDRYVTSEDYFFYIASVLLLLTIIMDIFILIRSRRPPTDPVSTDFV